MTSLRFSTLIGPVLAWPLFVHGCTPPRPHENGTFASGSGSDDVAQGGQSGQSTTTGEKSETTGTAGQRGHDEEKTPDEASDACPSPSDPTRSFTKAGLLQSVGECAARRFCLFSQRAERLDEDSQAYAEAPTSRRLERLEQQYHLTIESWSRAELFQFGPTASTSRDPVHGKGLRDLVYAWPYVSRCRVEEQLFGGAYDEYGFDNLVQVPINVRGLFAIEYLSFYDGVDNDCTAFSTTNAGQAWSALSRDELDALKLKYLKAVSQDVARRASELAAIWSPEGENFVEALAKNQGYDDQQHALNIVAQALLYVEREVKDYKLGYPAGLDADAPVVLPENSFSLQSINLIEENLHGFEDLFAGCDGEGLGFDDWLTEAGHADLAQDILEALEAAQSQARTTPDLHSATTEQLLALHASIKNLTDVLKSDLFGQGSPLGLTLPTALEGDTD